MHVGLLLWSLLPMHASAEVIFRTVVAAGAFGAPDGVDKMLQVVDDAFPGPELGGNVGDTLMVNVVNRLGTAIFSLHWHGLKQPGLPWFDGVTSLTECGIAPFSSFTYNVSLYHPGTYFWHSHSGMIRGEGAYGALIIRSPAEPALFGYTDERTILLADWWHESLEEVALGVNQPAFRWPGDPDCLLFNGKGRPDCAASEAAYINCTTPGALSTISVDAGVTYRLRLINAAGLELLRFAVEGHPLTIIAADSVYVEPFVVDFVDLNAGQRYDVLLTANVGAPGSRFWITQQARYREPVPGQAVLTYSGGTPPVQQEVSSGEFGVDPTGEVPPLDRLATLTALISGPNDMPNDAENAQNITIASATDWNAQEGRLSPIAAERAYFPCPQGAPNRTIVKQVSQQRTSDDLGLESLTPFNESTGEFTLEAGYENGYLRWFLGDAATYYRLGPALQQVFFHGVKYGSPNRTAGLDAEFVQTNVLPRQPNLYLLEKDEVIDLVLINGAHPNALNGASEHHPIHLHGGDFWIVSHGVGAYDPNAPLDTINPMWRDTVSVMPYQWVRIRIQASNPGVWLLHCHIDPHFEMGMAMIFAMDVENIPPPPHNIALCGVDRPDTIIVNTTTEQSSDTLAADERSTWVAIVVTLAVLSVVLIMCVVVVNCILGSRVAARRRPKPSAAAGTTSATSTAATSTAAATSASVAEASSTATPPAASPIRVTAIEIVNE